MKYYVEITFNDGTVHNVYETNYLCARDHRNRLEFKDGVRMFYIGNNGIAHHDRHLYEHGSQVVNGFDITGYYPKSQSQSK